jgi:predicted choloylglycine hydrolase
VWKTHWLKPVIGLSDCGWGLLDGINSDGLIVSLAFGGRKVIGKGMGIPLIIRYVLETCSDVNEAIEVLKRIPVHMSYNVTLIDRSSLFHTVYLSPDRETEVTYWAVGTNHQHQIEWPEYARVSATLERKALLDSCWLLPEESRTSLVAKFLKPPLFSTNYKKRFGTLYTAVYDAWLGRLDLYWRNKWFSQSFEHFEERTDEIVIQNDVTQNVFHQ